MAKQPWEHKAEDAVIRFHFKAKCVDMTDKQIKVAIAAMREVLLYRQQKRASAKYLAAKGK